MQVLTKFGKGAPGSYALNYGQSGGNNCDDGCAAKGTFCYSHRLEGFRKAMRDKLSKHESMPPARLTMAALAELQREHYVGAQIRWFRFSVSGSLPQPEEARGDKHLKQAIRTFGDWCRSQRDNIHCPVESYEKARFYRAMVGDRFVVRETAQNKRRFLQAKGPVAVVAGRKGQSRDAKVAEARQLAKQRRERTGRKTVICPYDMNQFAARRDPSKVNPRAKCGNCTACANPSVDIVYPLH